MQNGRLSYDENVRYYDLGFYDNPNEFFPRMDIMETSNLYFTISAIDKNDPVVQHVFRQADNNEDFNRIKVATADIKRKYGNTNTDSYGARMYGNGYFDKNQYIWLANRLTKKPVTKSATISILQPGEAKPPCLALLDFKFRNEKLDMTVVYRSQNVFLKQPGNLVALRKIQSALAEEIDFEVGTVDLLIISAHIYKYDWDVANLILEQNKDLISKYSLEG